MTAKPKLARTETARSLALRIRVRIRVSPRGAFSPLDVIAELCETVVFSVLKQGHQCHLMFCLLAALFLRMSGLSETEIALKAIQAFIR